MGLFDDNSPKEVLITYSGMTQKTFELNDNGSKVQFHLKQLVRIKGNVTIEFRCYIEYPNEKRHFFMLSLSELKGRLYFTEFPEVISVINAMELSFFILKHSEKIYDYLVKCLNNYQEKASKIRNALKKK